MKRALDERVVARLYGASTNSEFNGVDPQKWFLSRNLSMWHYVHTREKAPFRRALGGAYGEDLSAALGIGTASR